MSAKSTTRTCHHSTKLLTSSRENVIIAVKVIFTSITNHLSYGYAELRQHFPILEVLLLYDNLPPAIIKKISSFSRNPNSPQTLKTSIFIALSYSRYKNNWPCHRLIPPARKYSLPNVPQHSPPP